MNEPISQTALQKLRRAAKQRSREGDLAYTAALDQQARAAGYANWHDARRAAAAPAPVSVPPAESEVEFELPVDPDLPPHFDDLSNERRSKAELDRWWLRPFAVTLADGSYEVRCLDGGAWDRSTWYGHAKDLQEAREIARSKLERWQQANDTPIFFYIAHEAVLLSLEPNRPSCARPFLDAAGSGEAARKLAAQWDVLRQENPQAAALAVRAARNRTTRIATYDQAETMYERSQSLAVQLAGGNSPEFEDIALLASLYRLRDPGTLTTTFSVPEVASYLFHLGLGDIATVQSRLERVLQLQIDGRTLIESARSQERNEVPVWEVRFCSDSWPVKAVRRRK
jgi:hypothetical protein